jgi:ubiquinone/menaquinone biosynthesis C-methylase UbiE
MGGRMDETAAAARRWDRLAGGYDRATRFAERRWFAAARAWLVPRAHGDVLEVAVGTGANLPFYSADVRLAAVDVSPAMVRLARRRSAGPEVAATVAVDVGDAARTGAPDAAFDAVVCTFALCAVPDERVVLAELVRVLRPGGLLLLADHVESSSAPVRGLQCVLDVVSARAEEHYRRRPLLWAQESPALDVLDVHASRRRLVEAVVARRVP